MRVDSRFLFLNLGHAVDHLMMLLFPAVAVIMAVEMDASYAEILVLSTGGFIAFGAFSLPAGWLADRWSRETMLAVFFIGIGAMTALTGFAQERWQIAVCLFLIGMFAAIYHPVGIAMVSQGAAAAGGKVGRRLGVNGVWGNMGVAASALVAGALADLAGWRMAFLVPGVIAIAIGLLWIAHCRSSAGQAATQAGATARKSGAEPSADWKMVLTVVFIATAFGGFIFNATTISLPKVFDDKQVASLAVSGTEAGSLIALVYAVAAFTQIAVGHLIDRYSAKLVFLLLAIGDVAIFLVAAQVTGSVMLAVSLAMMMLVFGQIPITDTLVARNTPEHWRGRVYAIKYVLSFAIAATAVPAISGLHAYGAGFSTLFLICAACAAVIAVAVAFLPRTRPLAVQAGE
ncbi:MAG: MFS transporter [Thalassobaculaceae bacterium]|nr:MFS transporter [Thalassobaculaceae bacterium]